MQRLLLVLACLFIGFLVGGKEYYIYGPIYSGATTFNEIHDVTESMVWTKTGELAFPKYQNDTMLLFTCQITFTKSSNLTYGNKFKLRFKTIDGIYISDTPETGQISSVALAHTNVMLSDTVIDNRLGREPLAGNYIVELWVLTGGDVLRIINYETNIMVWENPVWIRIKK